MAGALLGGPAGRPTRVKLVEAALRTLPAHGWPAGFTGRRDRALLVLAEVAGLSFPQIAGLTAGDLSIASGTAAIRTPGGTTTLRAAEDNLLCGPCALARWSHALDLAVVFPEGPVLAAAIAWAVPLSADSPHVCDSNDSITDPAGRIALLPIQDCEPVSGLVTQPVSWGTPTVIHGALHVPTAQQTHDRTRFGALDIVTRARWLQRRVEQLLIGGH